MSRQLSALFVAPLIIPLQTDLIDQALFFVEGVRSSDRMSYSERHALVQEQLKLDEEEVDNLQCYLGDDFNVQLIGSQFDRSDYRLVVAPEEGPWSDISRSDFESLVAFIEKFGSDITFPVLLHSVKVDSSTYGLPGEELVSEFVHLSKSQAKIYQQSSGANNDIWSSHTQGRDGTGFLSDMSVADRDLPGLVTPTSTVQFE